MVKKPFVYCAGPITKGSYPTNIRNGINAMKLLNDNGYVPFCPMLDTLYAITFPETTYEQYLDYDFQVIMRCDALFRIPGESKGADLEIEFAHSMGIPVFTDFKELENWKNTVYGKEERGCCFGR